MLLAVQFYLDQLGIRLVNEDEGQWLVEYVLIIALIAVVVVGGFAAVSGGITAMFTEIAGLLA